MNNLSLKARSICESRFFQNFIMGLIIFNGIILGLETNKELMASSWGDVLHWVDTACLFVFVGELALAIFAYGLSFAKDPWRIFDTIVVGIALLPAGGGLSVLRGLRVLRVLRIINSAPSLKRIINAMVSAIPGMSSIFALLSVFYYVAAVMATKLFGDAFPDWFGTLGNSLYTLFQVMTLESWSMGIVRPVMEKFPVAWLFFVPFIVLATFTMLNLFVGVIVSAMQSGASGDESSDDPPKSPPEDLAGELSKLRLEIAKLRTDLMPMTNSESVRVKADQSIKRAG